MDVGSSILHHVERHLNACLTCLVMRHGTHGYHVTTKKCLGIAGFSPEVLQTLFTRMKNHQRVLLTGNTCTEIDQTLYDFNADNFDFHELPQWLLIIVTEKELSLPENISAICRWYRRLKAWQCDCLTVVTAITTPPSRTPPPPLSSRIQELCLYNPELEEMRSRHRLKSFYISHWDCIENSEQVFVELVHSWLSGNSPTDEVCTDLGDDEHMSYTNIAKILIRDVNQSLPQIEIFLRLFLMCILGLLSVFVTLGVIVFISKDGGIAQDVRKAQVYVVNHLQARRTGQLEWGRSHTPSILTALQIHSHNWCFDTTENRRSVDRLEIGILASLAKLSTKSRGATSYTPQRLAGDVNALLATFHNPRDFHDHDLVAMLRRYISDVIPYTSYSAHAYSSYVIALCNAGEDLGIKHADRIYHKQHKDGGFYLGINEAAISLIALSCVEQHERHLANLEAITLYIRHQRRNDGSYGSLYTTALVLQAYNITGVAVDTLTRKEATLTWLVSRCYGNAALKDPDVASAVLLALSGGTLLDISKILGVDHKKHIANATPSSSLLDKYRYLAPDVAPEQKPKSNNNKMADIKHTNTEAVTEMIETPSNFTNVPDSENVTSQSVISVDSIDDKDDSVVDSDNQNGDLDPDGTLKDHQHSVDKSDHEEAQPGHRWKRWKRKFIDPEEDSLSQSDLTNLGRRNATKYTRRFRDRVTMHENTMEYVFLSKCLL